MEYNFDGLCSTSCYQIDFIDIDPHILFILEFLLKQMFQFVTWMMK